MKKRYYIIIGSLAYLIFIIQGAPAAPIINAAQENNSIFRVESISGTIWHGNAQKIRVQKHYFENVSWSFDAAGLFLGKAGFEINGTYDSNPFSSQLSVGILGTLYAKNITTEFDIDAIKTLIQLPLGQLEGTINANIDSAQWDMSEIPVIVGKVQWNNAYLKVVEDVELGNIEAILEQPENHHMAVQISNKDGQIKLNGTIFIETDGRYSLNLTLEPEAGTSDNIRGSLAIFAKDNGNGSFTYTDSGNLHQSGFL